MAQIVQFVNQGAPVYFDGGFSVVDVDDVARGAIVAMEQGRTGERYILAGENVTVKQLFDLMAELTGLRAPSHQVAGGRPPRDRRRDGTREPGDGPPADDRPEPGG